MIRNMRKICSTKYVDFKLKLRGKIFNGFLNGYIGIDYLRKKNVIEEIHVH